MLKKKLATLINVKTLVTFAVTGVFVALALRGNIPGEVLAIITMVLGFYFGTQKQKSDDETIEAKPTSKHN